MKKRIERFAKWLEQETIDAAILTSTENVFYFSEFYSDPHERLLAIVLFPHAEPFLVCPQMEEETAKAAGFEQMIIGYKDTDDPWEKVFAEMKKRASGSVAKIAIEKSHMNVERYEILRKAFPSVRFIQAEEKLNELRAVKDPGELEKLRKACELADFAIDVGIHAIKDGASELAIVAEIEYELKKKGVEQMSFATTVLSGPKAASPHGSPDLTKVQKGQLVLFDLGVIYEGYCSDITRTVAFGEIDDEAVRIYETVRKAQEAAVLATKPGVTCANLDLTARKIIQDAGYGEYFTHRLGHGLGISIHEFPSVTETNPLVLAEGMVFTIEPGIYIPNRVGVRIEDSVAVTATGVEVLTKYPKELQFV
ncbi:Xaa-Pro peptidase family protein [Caldifermentibacillus hisashii]|uniref:M24 family metallopeptidase n=1 Tax=Caldifermentibacillus hisashii TaxID=996558 RepID=UPI00310118F8